MLTAKCSRYWWASIVISVLTNCGGAVVVRTCPTDCKFNEVCDAQTLSCRARRCTATSDCGQGRALICAAPDGGSGQATCQPNTCVIDEDCSDFVACNGVERCLIDRTTGAGTCAAATSKPCGEAFLCTESTAGATCNHNPNCDRDHDQADSIACGGNDCDDNDASRRPGATEVCDVNRTDEDCDPTTVGNRDADGDGYTDSACCNGQTCGNDCDDSNPRVHPNQPESCNGVDDNCDQAIDETVLVAVYPDADHDGYGATDAGVLLRCPGTPGYSILSNDCDDRNAAITPGAMVCTTESTHVLICTNTGVYFDTKCSSGTTCFTQPNSTAICR